MGDLDDNSGYPVDQTVQHDKDANASIHDDGRTIRYGGLVLNSTSYPAAVPEPGAKRAFIYTADKLLPETVYIHSDQFLATEWESMYSQFFGPGHSQDLETFVPVIDHDGRVVGHLGWIDGYDISVPRETVRRNSGFWDALENRRVEEDRQVSQRVEQYFSRAAPRSPSPEPRVYRCVPIGPTMKLGAMFDVPRVSTAPANDAWSEDRHQDNLNYFLKGGGKAYAGSYDRLHVGKWHQGYDSYHREDWSLRDGRARVDPNVHGSSGYRFLVLVDPEGSLQAVLETHRVQRSLAKEVLGSVLELIDIAMTISMIIDIPVFLAGVVVRMMAIRAIRLVLDEAAKAALKRLLEREAKAALETVTEVELKAATGGTEMFAVEDIVYDAETMERWRARGARLHLEEPGGETVGVGELWRDGAETPEEYWAKSGRNNEKLTRPGLTEEEAAAKAKAAEAEAAEATAEKARNRGKKLKPTPPKPTDQPIATYVTQPKPIEGLNKGIPEHMADSTPAEKHKWLNSKEGNKWLDTQKVEGVGHAGNRNHEAETYMFRRLGELTTKDTKGEFHFMMDHPTCPACQNLQFGAAKARPYIKFIQHNPKNKLFITKAASP